MIKDKFEHKKFLRYQSKCRSIEKRSLKLNNKIDRFSDYTSHNLKEFVDPSDFVNVNKILKKHIYRNNKLEHELLKVNTFTELLYLGNDVILEPKLKPPYSNCRPDILLLNQIPAIAYEIVCSEKESSLINKDIKYPFKIIKLEVNLK